MLLYTAVMATTKKSAPKKTVKNAAPKKVATKKTSTRKRTSKSILADSQSFKLIKSDTPFLTFTPTLQTLYWAILGVVVIAFTVWMLKMQSDIQAIYDQIDQSISTSDYEVPVEKSAEIHAEGSDHSH